MMQEIPTQPAEAAPAPPSSLGNCENCGAPLYGKYCYACGQPTHGLVRHFGSVLSDIADSVLNVDERLFRTIGPLYFRPGKLTLDYFAGRRARYVTPFRMVFFLAIVAFFAVQLTVRAGFTHIDKAVSIPPSSSAPVAATPKSNPAEPDNGPFSHGNISFNDHVIWNRDTQPFAIRWLPGAANDWLNDLIGNAQQQLHQMNAGSWTDQQSARQKFTLGMFSAWPTVLFLLLPVFALLLKIFYIFKRRLYMEHLIVAMHSHAFLMLSILVLVALATLRGLLPHSAWVSVPLGLLTAVVWTWIFVYLFLMQKRVYRQGWVMTTLKYGCLGFCYTILFGFGWVFAVLLSLTGA